MSTALKNISTLSPSHNMDIANLGKRKQKEVLIKEMVRICQEMIEAAESENECKLKAKKLRLDLKRSEFGKRIQENSALRSESKKRVAALSIERTTILKLAKELGVDIKSELSNIKMLD